MDLKGENIIIFGLPRFDSKIESTNFTTARLLAKNNKVYYVENPFTLFDYFKLRKKPEFLKRKSYFSITSTDLIDTDTEDLKVVIPPIVLSVNFLPEGKIFRVLLRFNEYLIRTKLKGILKKYKISNPIFINSFNFHYPGISEGLHPKLTMYHCLDPMILPFNQRHGFISEDLLVRKSNVIICSSRQLYLEKKQFNPSTYFVANAADLKHSSKALNEELAVSPLISNLKKPVIGYFGAIERRMDFDLLKTLVQDHPDKTFAFVGPISESDVPTEFYSYSNVLFTGPVAYEEMPAIIKGFDLALIPFKVDEVSRTIFPLKLFEYLGAGKAVVSTEFNPDLKEFTEDTVQFCSDAESFSKAVQTSIDTNGEENKAKRIRIASLNTWENRVEQISDILARHLNKA